MSEKEGQQRKGAERDRVCAVEEVEQSVPTAAALIATIVKRGQEIEIGSTTDTRRRREGPKVLPAASRDRIIDGQ